jgi:uncharacterized protein (DUF427 family)
MTGRGPLGQDPMGWFTPPVPSGEVFVEPHHRRVQAMVGDTAVIDTERALLVHRPGQTLSFAFPEEIVGELPTEKVPEAPGYVKIPWDAVDAWIEEGRRLVHYPPNPYHRVDCRPTDRGIRAEVGGTVLVDTIDTMILFETSLAPVLYVDKTQLRMDLLEPSASGKQTYCNYKGWATYWSARIGDRLYEDVAWSYEDPLPESLPIKGMISFDLTRTNVIAELPQAPDNINDCGCAL